MSWPQENLETIISIDIEEQEEWLRTNIPQYVIEETLQTKPKAKYIFLHKKDNEQEILWAKGKSWAEILQTSKGATLAQKWVTNTKLHINFINENISREKQIGSLKHCIKVIGIQDILANKKIILPEKKEFQIHHITHINNIASILKNGLQSDTKTKTWEQHPINIGNTEIKERRTQKNIDLEGWTNVGEAIPLYFTTRSPMLNAVRNYQEQENIVYLTTKTTKIKNKWCYTDGNAASRDTKFYTDSQFTNLDWDCIETNLWADKETCRKKQAELLTQSEITWETWTAISTIDKETKEKVEKICEEARVQIPINIEPNWYF